VTGEGDGEWRLYWTARDRLVPCRLVPVLSGSCAGRVKEPGQLGMILEPR
jgi:hypothetical protein